jgi:hypothetical protein
MSHGKERKEKNCLNCNARVFGSYCHVCGQENTEPKETAWGLVVHFFNDITHFEGKFIASLRYLLFKPGFLTAEYLRGRRASYMNPVRMYVFTSAFFFIMFFSFFSATETTPEVFKVTDSDKKGAKVTKPVTQNEAKEAALNAVDTKEDSALIEKIMPGGNGKNWVTKDSIYRWRKGDKDSTTGKDSTTKRKSKFKTMAEYDSAQNSLPINEQDHWIQRAVQRRMIIVDEKYGGDHSKFNRALFEHALHSLPKMLFVSLPLFALILSLLYIRRKQFYYVNHLVFTIHLFVFAFLILLLIFSVNKLQKVTGVSDFEWISGLLWFYMFFYLYKAMRRMYQQGRAKTMVKYFLLLFIALFINSFLFVGLFSYSFFNI